MSKVLPIALIAALFGCPRAAAPVSAADRAEVDAALATFREIALVPARIPPPSVAEAPEARAAGAVGRAEPIRAEDAAWNTWPAGPRLFNNAAALLFHVRIEASGPISWSPTGATLEINDERTALRAAPSAEVLLTDLLFHAYLEEQWAVEGDLVARTRGAGPFRAAYLPAGGDDVLQGVIAFPVDRAQELHVVAMRLTVPIRTPAGSGRLVWVFD